MIDEYLFYIAFSGQIFLISYYYPGKFIDLVNNIIAKYPPTTHPMLYPMSMENIKSKLRSFRFWNHLIFFLSLVLLAYFVDYMQADDWRDGYVVSRVTLIFLIQCIPMFTIMVTMFNYYKLMRNAAPDKTRKATLQPRRLFDFISPTVVALAVFTNIAFVLIVLFILQNPFPGFGGYTNIVMVMAMNLFLTGGIIKNLYGKKANPYQAYKDRLFEIKINVKIMVYSSILISVSLSIFLLLQFLGLESFLPVSVCMLNILCYSISFWEIEIPVEHIDFNVYKANTMASHG